MARSIKVLSAEMDASGNLIAAIEVTRDDGSTYQRQWSVRAADVAAITSAPNVATAVQEYIAQHWPAAPAWVADFVGQTITL